MKDLNDLGYACHWCTPTEIVIKSRKKKEKKTFLHFGASLRAAGYSIRDHDRISIYKDTIVCACVCVCARVEASLICARVGPHSALGRSASLGPYFCFFSSFVCHRPGAVETYWATRMSLFRE